MKNASQKNGKNMTKSTQKNTDKIKLSINFLIETCENFNNKIIKKSSKTMSK